MNIKRSLLVVGAFTSISAAGLGGNALVSAAETSTQSGDGTNSLVTKLAQKFNLKSEDVQAVFDEDRSTKDAERQAKVETELSQAVTDGKLTADQKDKIIAKQQELEAAHQTNRDANKDKTEAERKTEMDAERTALEKWATDNSIPTDYMKYVQGGHKGGGPR